MKNPLIYLPQDELKVCHVKKSVRFIRFIALSIAFLSFFIFSVNAQNCTVNAGVDFSLCANSTLTLGGGKAGLFQGAGNINWSQVSGPSAIITDPSNLGTTVTSLVGGNVYKFRLSATCSDGSLVYDEVSVSVLSISTANAGPDQTVCPGNSATNLAALPLNAGETGTWAIQGTNNGITIVTPSSPTSSINVSSANSGNTTIRWTITNGTCTSFDDVIITNRGGAPVVNAGSDRVLNSCYATTQSTNPSGASLGGGGIALGQTGLWTVVDGPNVPTISSPNSNNATFSNLIQGIYTFRWTVSGTCVNGTDVMQVTVPAPNGGITTASILSPATTSSGTSNYCDGRTEIVLVGSVPTKPNETVNWTKIGTAGGTIDSPTSSTINVSTLVPGASYTNTNTYTYTISSTNGCPVSSTTRLITWTAPPTLSVTTSSPLILGCGVSSATISYSSSGGSGSVQWMILSGPVTPAYPVIPTAWSNGGAGSVTLNGLTKPGTYQLRFQKLAGNGSGCSAVFQDFTVVVAQIPTASNAGTDQVLSCNVFNTNLVGNVPSVGTGMWTQISGPNTANLPSPNLNNSPISGLISGKYTFRWLISSGNTCANTQNDVSVIVSDPSPTASAAGSDITICNSTPLILTGNSPKLNETGLWTVTPSAGVSFSDNHSPISSATGMAPNTTYTFTWTISNACGTSADNVLITTNATVGPIPSDAGPDQCLPSGTTTATMAGNSPGAGTGTWTQISGVPATITNPLQNNTTITALSGGTSKFEWSITRNTCTVTRDTVSVTISGPATTSNAGPDQNVCGTSTFLAGNIPSTGTGFWTQTGGPGGVTIADPALPNSAISGLLAGAYIFRWKISNNACASNFDDVQINVSMPPTTTNAGADQSICSGVTATMAGNVITNGTGLWTIVSGPNSPTITTPGSPTTTITGLTNGTYNIRWRSYNGAYCPVSTDDMTVDITTAVTNASLGGNQSLCGANSATLTGNQSTIGTWTQDAGPNTSTISAISSSTALATGLIPGAYTFRYTYTTPTTCSNTATITVTIAAMPTPADAGADMNICDANSVAMAGNIASAGSGLWSKISGPNTPNIVNASSPTTSIGTTTSLVNGTYVYRWTITNGNCITSDDMIINRSSSTTVANAGPDQPSVCGTVATMAANAPAPGVGSWSQISGPNTATISSVILPNTTMTGLIPGTYVFRWSITNGFCSPSTDDVSVTMFATPTIANAGPDQTLCGNPSTTLAANTILVGTGLWSQISGPNTAVFTLNTNPSTTVTGLIAGTYVFQWSSTNGSCSSSDNVSVFITEAPSIALAGPDQNICLFAPLNLTGNTPVVGTGSWSQISGNAAIIQSPASSSTSITGVTSGTYGFRWTITNGTCPPSTDDVVIIVNDLPSLALAGPDQSLCNVPTATMAATPAVVGTGTWTKVSGPNSPSITNPNLASTTITGMIPGTYIFDWTIANGPCISSDQVQVIIAATPTTANAGADQNLCGTSSATLEGNTAISGSGIWTRVSGPNTPAITNINSENSTVTGLITGTYIFKWTISNGSCTASSDNVQIAVTTGSVTLAAAGSDQTGPALCGLTTTTLAANIPVTGTGLWSLHSGIGGTFGNSSDNTSSFSGNAGSTYVARWTITNGTCSSFDDVTISFPKNPTVSDAGADQNGVGMCGATSVLLNANAPTVGTGLWTIVSGSGGSFDNTSSPLATFSGINGTIYSLKWTISNSPCNASEDLVNVEFKNIPAAPTGSSPQTFCTGISPDLNSIIVTGTNIKWYDASTGGNLLPGTKKLVGGTTYYATQTVNGCESNNRLAITVTTLSCIGPVLDNIAVNLDENSANGTFVFDEDDAVTGNDKDGDNSSILYSIFSENIPGAFSINPSSGFIRVANSSLLDFEINPVFILTIKATDGDNDAFGTVTINLNNLNDNNPVALPDSYSVTEGGTLTVNNVLGVLSNDSDADGNSLTSILVTNVSKGILTLNADGSFTYIHNGSESSTDSFTYQAFDGLNNGNIATVTITINPVNDNPAVGDLSKSGNEDVVMTFTAADFTGSYSDAESDPMTKIKILSLPLNGKLKLSGVNVNASDEILTANISNLTFVPDPNWNGNTNFGWNGFDGTIYAASGANVNITVNPVNDLPLLTNITKTINENTVLTFTGIDFTGSFSDIDGNTLVKILITSLPANGTLKLGGSDVNINDEITVSDLGTLTFTPDLNWAGSTGFGWNGFDGTSFAVPDATVDITVNTVNSPPMVGNISKSMNEDDILNFAASDFTAAFTDIDFNILTKIRITSLPANGTLKLAGVIVSLNDEITTSNLPTLTFVPDPNWNGITTFGWNGFDGTVYAITAATVTITVNPVNDPPTVTSISKSVNEDNILTFSASDFTSAFSDIDGNLLTKVKITSLPLNGSLKLSGTLVSINDEILLSSLDNLTYTPAPNWNGTNSFGWNGYDGTVYATAAASVNIVVNPVNDIPVIISPVLRLTINENDGPVQINISANVSDPDGNLLTTSVTANPKHGTYSVTVSGNLIYTPNTDFSGNDTILYQVCDNGSPSLCVSGEIIITVTASAPVNHIPVISEITRTTSENQSFMFVRADFLSEYSDADNDTLFKIQITSLPTAGTLKLNGVSITSDQEITWKQLNMIEFIPEANFTGESSFTWKAYDGKDYSAPAYIRITVTPAEFFIPEGFSPNGDGINDFFMIRGTDNNVVSVSIYNRWGNMVYSSKNYKNDWDGVSNTGLLLGSKLPDGTYYYVINLNNGEKAKIGYITINR
jgi:gliding motility-associated-like protein